MSRTKTLLTKVTASAALLLAGFAAPAYAHETDDVHHWFDHQRARVEGGEVGILQAEQPAAPRAARVAASMAQLPPRDCLTEELKRGEGYVPEPCDPATESRRWVVDEDKDDARRLGLAPSR